MLISCEECGKKVPTDTETCPHCGSSIPKFEVEIDHDEVGSEKQPDGPIYREPTMKLRLTIFLMYYLFFMTIAITGVFVFFIPPTALLFFPILYFEYWIASNLGKFDKRARYLALFVALMLIIVNIAVIIITQEAVQLIGMFTLLLGCFMFYTLVLDRKTVMLFSGRYQPDPDYTLFKQ